MNNFSRATSALVLTASLLASSVAAVGQTSTTKTTEQEQKTSQTQTETKSPAADPKAEQKAQPATTTAKSTSNKPLSTNENPDMIGKRNINTGIIAKMSGSIKDHFVILILPRLFHTEIL